MAMFFFRKILARLETFFMTFWSRTTLIDCKGDFPKPLRIRACGQIFSRTATFSMMWQHCNAVTALLRTVGVSFVTILATLVFIFTPHYNKATTQTSGGWDLKARHLLQNSTDRLPEVHRRFLQPPRKWGLCNCYSRVMSGFHSSHCSRFSILRCGPQLLQCCCGSSRHSMLRVPPTLLSKRLCCHLSQTCMHIYLDTLWRVIIWHCGCFSR